MNANVVTWLALTTNPCYMAKINLKKAFRLCLVRRENWDLLEVYWDGQYYVGKRLLFGLRSSPALFNQVADAFEWILVNECQINRVPYYLDDFFFVETDNSTCRASMTRVKDKAHQLGVLMEPSNETGPTTTITLLGIELDLEALVARLSPEKLRDLMDEILQMLSRCKVTKRDLQSIIGKLSFASKVIPASRMFLRQLINLTIFVRLSHHRAYINSKTRKNFQWWYRFLPSWNGVAMMLDLHLSVVADMELYTDVFNSHGYRAVTGSRKIGEYYQTLESGKSIA